MQRLDRESAVCQWCGDEFSARVYRNPSSRAKTCSASCRRKLEYSKLPVGFCRWCKKVAAEDGKSGCRPCLDKLATNARVYKKRSKGSFLCSMCGEEKSKKERAKATRLFVPDWCRSCGEGKASGGEHHCTRCDTWRDASLFVTARRENSRIRRLCKYCAAAAMYGLSADDYTALEDMAEGACCVCLQELDSGKGTSRHIDHCHATGQVRGMICESCNLCLGLAKDSVETLERAISYLRNPPAKLYLGVKLAPVDRERDLEEYLN